MSQNSPETKDFVTFQYLKFVYTIFIILHPIGYKTLITRNLTELIYILKQNEVLGLS